MTEALSSGNVIATAKRHGIQAQQIYRWRERLDERQSLTAFLPVSMAPDTVPLSQAPMPDQDHCPAALLDRSPRVEIVLRPEVGMANVNDQSDVDLPNTLRRTKEFRHRPVQRDVGHRGLHNRSMVDGVPRRFLGRRMPSKAHGRELFTLFRSKASDVIH